MNIGYKMNASCALAVSKMFEILFESSTFLKPEIDSILLYIHMLSRCERGQNGLRERERLIVLMLKTNF